MKRKLEDGQLSKDEYERQHSYGNINSRFGLGSSSIPSSRSAVSPPSSSSFPSTFQRAPDAELADRNIVKTRAKTQHALASERNKNYLHQLQNLNQMFAKRIQEAFQSQSQSEIQRLKRSRDDSASSNSLVEYTVEQDPVLFIENAQEYLSYLGMLSDKYLKKRGEIFHIGSNEVGQGGMGYREDSDENAIIYRPTLVKALESKNICNIACGGLHTLAVSTDGKVYSWGCNDEGPLGRLCPDESEYSPMVVEDLSSEFITDIACGDTHSVALTATGKCYEWGAYRDSEGNLFLGSATRPEEVQHYKAAEEAEDEVKEQTKSILTTPSEKKEVQGAVMITCGAATTYALMDDQTVLSWGVGKSGELGRPLSPMKVEVKNERTGEVEEKYEKEIIFREWLTPGKMVIQAGCTSESYNRCKTNSSPLYSPSKMVGNPPIIARTIGAGAYHVLVVSAYNSEVFSCGLNNYGQCGFPEPPTEREKDGKHQLLSHIKIFDNEENNITSVAGGNFHSLALCGLSGKVYSFGRMDDGCLGNRNITGDNSGKFEYFPQQVQFPSDEVHVTQIASGSQHCIALSDENKVYTWGFGDTGALGHGDETSKSNKTMSEMDRYYPTEVVFPRNNIIQLVVKVDGGGQHSAILASLSS